MRISQIFILNINGIYCKSLINKRILLQLQSGSRAFTTTGEMNNLYSVAVFYSTALTKPKS